MTKIHFLLTLVLHAVGILCDSNGYYGSLIGDFTTHMYNVKGRVYAANQNTLILINFSYDGEGPDAYFWAGTSQNPSSRGILIPDERGRTEKLGEYKNKNLRLTLPVGQTLSDIKWISVWSQSHGINFGHVMFPPTLNIPKPQNLGSLPTYAHGLRSGSAIIHDTKTISVSRLYYDGSAPDAFFLVGKGPRPRSVGAIKVPDEKGSLDKLRGYDGVDVTLRLSGNLTFFDVDWFSVYCISFEQNFGHLMIPNNLNVPPYFGEIDIFQEEDMTTATSDTVMSVVKADTYYGKLIGDFITNVHDVKGKVYAAKDNTFYIEGFTYDGKGPDAFFWAGSTAEPSSSGFIVPDELGTNEVLKSYSGQNLVLTLPFGRTIKDIKWLSVWCRRFTANFGYIKISEDLEIPKELNVGILPSFSHGLRSGPVLIKDLKNILISRLFYDGSAPDAYFFVGSGPRPHSGGTKVPDENGSLESLRPYRGREINLRLPGNLTAFDIDWLSVYGESSRENFGHVKIPKELNIPADLEALKSNIEFDNCEEIVPEKLQVSWKLTNQSLFVQMEGVLGPNEYMAFGRSGHDERPQMVGADVAVAFYDQDLGMVRVVDYFLTSKGQCTRTNGACPDLLLGGSQNIDLLSSFYNDGKLKVTFKRPLLASDPQDLSIPTFVPVSIVAAIGPLNSRKEVAFHTTYFTKTPLLIDFNRSPPTRNCRKKAKDDTMTHEDHKSYAWAPKKITRTETFLARIGPAGGSKGYTAITGQQSWGISWWINGYIIPELVVVRGKNYTFIVEGGDDPNRQASFHPLYITNNPEGGIGQTPSEIGTRENMVFAGLEANEYGEIIPIGVGRYCEYKHQGIDRWEQSETFEEYNATLQLWCEQGEPGSFVWTPDEYTPDLVYYQCFTHRNFGWKIHVVDEEPPEELQFSASASFTASIAMLVVSFALLWVP